MPREEGLPVRRLSQGVVVSVRRQERIGRRLAKWRDDADVRDASVRWGQRRAVMNILELMRSECRDYFTFEEYEDARGNIIVCGRLKVFRDE